MLRIWFLPWRFAAIRSVSTFESICLTSVKPRLSQETKPPLIVSETWGYFSKEIWRTVFLKFSTLAKA